MKPRTNNRCMTVVCVTLLVGTFFGCSEHGISAPSGVTRTEAGSSVQRKISSTAKPLPQVRSNFSGKKDPFRSYMAASKSKLSLPSASEHRLPIQKYEVNQFSVLGIIAGLAMNQAMVQDPVGKSYVIKEGTMIGPHNGRVVQIRERSIEVIEQFREESGRIRKRDVKLTLPRKE